MNGSKAQGDATMQTIRTVAATLLAALLLVAGAGMILAQEDEPTQGLAVVGLQFVDSTGSGDAIVSVTTPSAASVELHESIVGDDGAIGMVLLAAIPVPAGGETLLAADGYHFMLVDPVDTVTPGGTVELAIELEVAGAIETVGVVVPLAGTVVTAPPPVADLPTSFTVEAMDNFFVPNTLEAPANTEIKVTLLNYGFLPHNIAFFTDDSASQLLSEDSLTSVIDPETEAIARFTTPGPGEYFILCVIHPEMTGVLIVR